MRIITLAENTTNYSELKCEKGLSLYIEFNDKKIIFDTGAGKNFIYNAAKLGINLEEIDYVIISHAHSGHTGGLGDFLKINKKAKVCMKPEALDDYYINYGPMNSFAGISKSVFVHNKHRFCFTRDNVRIFRDAYLINNIACDEKYKAKNSSFMELRNNQLISDCFSHELFLVLVTNHKLDIFTGCSHNGIVNIIETANIQFNRTPIRSLIGGFHLTEVPQFNELNYTPNYIDRIILKLYILRVDKGM